MRRLQAQRRCSINITRRNTIVGAAATLAASTASRVSGQAITTIRYGSSPLIDGVPIYYAQQAGLFRSAGLDVQIQKFANSSAIAAALAGGALDIGEVSPMPLINAHLRGLGLLIIFPNKIHLTGRPYDTAIIVSPTFPYRSASDLNGKTMSSAAVGDTAWLAARVFLDAGGGDSSTVKFVEVPFSAVAAAIESGRLDGGVSGDPYLSAAVKSGKARSIGDIQAGFGPRLIDSTYASTTDYIAKNRDVVTRFVRVVREAHMYMNTHRNELATLTEAFTGIERAKQSPDAINFVTTYTPADIQGWIDAGVKYKVLPRSFDAAELFATL